MPPTQTVQNSADLGRAQPRELPQAQTASTTCDQVGRAARRTKHSRPALREDLPRSAKVLEALGSEEEQRCERLQEDLERSGERRREVAAWLEEGGVVESLAFTKHGSRVVQKFLDVGSTDEKAGVALALYNHTVKLVDSPHGNHVLAKLIEVLPDSELEPTFSCFVGKVVEVTKQRFGCRIIERLLENLGHSRRTALCDEIILGIRGLVRHKWGNFVASSLFDHGSDAACAAAADKLLGAVPEIAKDRHGSHVVQRLMKRCPDKQGLCVSAILEAEGEYSLEALVKTRPGSYVAQQIIENKYPRYSEVIARARAILPELRENDKSKKNLIDHFGEEMFA